MLRALQRRRGDCLFAAAAAAHVPCVAQWWSSLPVEFNQTRDVMRRTISTTISSGWGLDELIRPRVIDSKEDSDGKQQASKTASSSKSLGRAWEARELRNLSWDDLHHLWIDLYKEKNALHAEKLEWRKAGQRMPNATRLSKTRLSMNRIKQVMSERLKEHDEDPNTRAYLKAFIDSM
eukprot:jgi/Picsp_1/3874/NSC_01386-R1_39s ribosomal protein l47